jgi:hypothetical protein
MKSSLFVLIMVATCLASPAASQIIAFSGDAQGISCTIPVTPYGTGTAYIVATLGGSAPQAMGFEFATTGWPAEWLTNVTHNPAANVILGDPTPRPGLEDGKQQRLQAVPSA